MTKIKLLNTTKLNILNYLKKESMSLTEVKKEISKGLTLRVLIIVFLSMPLTLWVQDIMQTLFPWWLYGGWYPLPIIFYIIIEWLITLVKPKWALRPQEWVILMVGIITIGGIQLYNTFDQFNPLWIATHEPFKSSMSQWILPWQAPMDEEVLYALQYGGAYDFGKWLPSIIYWTIFGILWSGVAFSWAFINRRPLIEVEKLTFPGWRWIEAVTLQLYLTKTEGGKSALFSFGKMTSRHKFFWIGLILGLIYALPAYIHWILPGVPPVGEYGVWDVDFSPLTRGILPGAYTRSTFQTTQTLYYFFIPVDFLANIVLFYLIFYVLYPTIGVRAGFLPYTVGVETDASYYSWNNGPFKFNAFAAWGGVLGVALWFLYRHRKHFLTVLSLTFQRSRPDEYDEGMSYRFVGTLAILFPVAWFIFLVASGVPPQSAITFLIIYMLMCLAWSYSNGFIWEFMGDISQYRWFGHDSGFGTAWTSVPGKNFAAFQTQLLWFGGQRMSPLMMHYQGQRYWLANQPGLKTRAKEVFIIIAFCAIVGQILNKFWQPWWFTTLGGFARVGGIPYHAWSSGSIEAFTTGNPSPPIEAPERYALTISGIIVTWIMFLLRMKFTWFILNPVTFVILPTMTWCWTNAMIALIIKFILIRIGGIKIWDEYAVPAFVGAVVGNGVFSVFVNIHRFITLGIPAWLGGA